MRVRYVSVPEPVTSARRMLEFERRYGIPSSAYNKVVKRDD